MEMLTLSLLESLHVPVSLGSPLCVCVNKACFVVVCFHSQLEEKGFSRKHQEKKKKAFAQFPEDV